MEVLRGENTALVGPSGQAKAPLYAPAQTSGSAGRPAESSLAGDALEAGKDMPLELPPAGDHTSSSAAMLLDRTVRIVTYD